MSCRMRGLLVTMPLPRGRKSRPTIFSSTEDFPDDCDPTTTLSPEHQVSGLRISRFGCYGGTYNLREVEGIIPNGVEDKVLQLVYDPQKIVPKRSHYGPNSLDRVLTCMFSFPSSMLAGLGPCRVEERRRLASLRVDQRVHCRRTMVRKSSMSGMRSCSEDLLKLLYARHCRAGILVLFRRSRYA